MLFKSRIDFPELTIEPLFRVNVGNSVVPALFEPFDGNSWVFIWIRGIRQQPEQQIRLF
jgi:hypothetical protein